MVRWIVSATRVALADTFKLLATYCPPYGTVPVNYECK